MDEKWKVMDEYFIINIHEWMNEKWSAVACSLKEDDDDYYYVS
jgi:hypothetical protein